MTQISVAASSVPWRGSALGSGSLSPGYQCKDERGVIQEKGPKRRTFPRPIQKD